MEPSDVSNLSHELWAEIRADTKQLHDYRVFRQLLGKSLHLLLECGQSLGDGLQLEYCLLHHELSVIRFRHYADMTTGRSIDVQCFIFAEIVTVLLAPLLVFLRECRWSKPTDALTMPEGFYEIQPLFTAISPSGTAKQAVCIWKSNIQKGNEVVFHHCPNFGEVFVLTVAVLQHHPNIFFGKVLRQLRPVVNCMARYIAKNLVAAGLCAKCQVTLAYAIGKAEPVMVEVDTFGTGTVCADDCLAEAVKLVFGLTPAEIISQLDLLTPRYTQTAAYGHFGKPEFPWERTNQAKILQAAVI